MVDTLAFDEPEIGIYVKCDVHAWMNARIHVLDHPFFAVTGEDGTFEIRNVPPGEYELSVWHEFHRFRPDAQTVKVRVEAGKTAHVDFTYRPVADE